MSPWILVVLAALVIAVGPFVYLSTVLARGERQTRGLEYYGRSPEERRRFRARLSRQARLLGPVVRTLARLSTFRFGNVGFEVDGVPGPKGTCSPESFRRGLDYEARPDDVFVATPMKCGTTWMQQIVYEVLHRGAGDLVESGTALYAVSPWLEAETSVSLEEAPLLGREPRKRIIKTHLPARVCPRHPEARYVYVARDPVSCFASCRDFLATNLGPFCPDLPEIVDWFTSEQMWWGPWPAHVAGWWERARTDGNVLFVRFEEMKEDLAAVVRRVADFLDVPELSEEEVAEVVRKSGFAYMKEHQEAFEMHPPHLIAADPVLFVRGTRDRFRDVPPELDGRIREWCQSELGDSDFPMDELYPRRTT